MKQQTKIVIKIVLGLSIILAASLALPAHAEAPNVPKVKLEDKPLVEIVEYYARKANISPKMLVNVMQCESEGSMHPKGYNDGGRAHGAFQFHIPTWIWFTKMMGEKLDINSGYDQAKVAAWAFSKGYQNHWSCYKKVKDL